MKYEKEKKASFSCSYIVNNIIDYTNMFKSSYKVSDRTLKVREKSSEGYPVMGWVRVQGTNIDYPVLYAQDRIIV